MSRRGQTPPGNMVNFSAKPSEFGLYYLNSRYYDPAMCRFINADGYVYTGQGNSGLNMYAYCANNPVNKYDPTGNDCICLHQRVHNHNCAKYRAQQQADVIWNHFKNDDGSYSLYNSERLYSNRTFREKIFTLTTSSPAFSINDCNFSTGTFDFTVISGAWKANDVTYSLLDMGEFSAGAGFTEKEFGVFATASIWAPSVSFVLWDMDITISLKVGSIGFEAKASYTEGISFGRCLGCGYGITIR